MKLNKILLVENIKEYRETVQEFLERRGFCIFGVSSPAAAQTVLKTEEIDLVVLDVRLMSEGDEQDESGLELAKRLPPAIPKLILTRFPTVDLVRQAYGPALDGLPLAVGFIDKREGMYALLEAVQLALMKFPPTLHQSLLREFSVSALVALSQQKAALGSQKFIQHWLAGQDAAAYELNERRKWENRHLRRLRNFGLVAKCFWMGLLAVACVALWWGQAEAAYVSTAFSLVTGLIDAFFSWREDQSLRELRRLDDELLAIEYDRHLFGLCDLLENPVLRDEERQKVLAHILQRRTRPTGTDTLTP
jgi:CheY-like chemotaxis protein